MIGYLNSIETMGLVDGPGVRFVAFLSGCKLRCLYCHNPETWKVKDDDIKITPIELVEKIKRYIPYYENGGGVTFSGGEPLLQKDFLIETLKLLKKENIHTAIDTAGVGIGDYEEILKYVDLVILDIKSIDPIEYKYLTGQELNEFYKFLSVCQSLNKKMWVRQVVVPGINDTKENIFKLNEFLSGLKNIEKVELLPYRTLGIEKYQKLGIKYPLEGVLDLKKEKLDELSSFLNY